MPFSLFGTPSPPSLPAACAQCVQTLVGAELGALPISNALAQFRSIEGMIRIDLGIISLITNPLTGVRILLNHLTLEALTLPHLPGIPGLPGFPSLALAIPSLPAISAPNLIQLGKSIIEGELAEGILHIFPVIPGLPLPTLQSWEVWASSKLKMPLLTKMIGTFGVTTTICKCTLATPSPALFQIPPGYTTITPPTPPVPGSISVPSPGVPSMPAVPLTSGGLSIPSVPQPSGGLSVPAVPQAPGFSTPSVQMPGVPSPPALPQAPGFSTPSVQMPGSLSRPSVQTPGVPSPPALPQAPATPAAPTIPPVPPFKIPGKS